MPIAVEFDQESSGCDLREGGTMGHLAISLLGSFRVTLDGQPVTGFKSNKERALLAYLAVEADRPHRREVLAGLLWPEWPDRDALSNLRYALSNLRLAIGDRVAEPAFLLITRDSLQFNAASDAWLDAAVLEAAVAVDQGRSGDLNRLERAVAVYQGGFLEGFSVSDSAGFEEWALLTRERLRRQMLVALHQLAAGHERIGEYEQAQRWAWRQIELEPWDEGARQQLMRALALGGQRGAALAQYEACRRQLAEELGVEPSPETTRLYEQIRDGRLGAPGPLPSPRREAMGSLPGFLEQEPPHVESTVFVARERELARLEAQLAPALAGRGRVAFVTGEAGSGKTALLQEFARRAQEAHPDLIAASGNCNAYTGIGDPYLPFREILGLLTGDIEAGWAAGAISGEHARRLWRISPVAAEALFETGPDLVDTLVPRTALIERSSAYAAEIAERLARLDGIADRRPAASLGSGSVQQINLFEQYTRMLQFIAKRSPLLLVLDDLQWADLGSISLLFHLGRRLAGSRILVLGAYRPEDVALGRDGARHPLEPVVNELQRDYGDVALDLGQAEGREFLEAILDSEPNRLGPSFREMLYRQTGGHPLFTIELLRGLQERGDLVRDSEGRWIEGPALNWEALPARVEAVVAERIGRLAEPLQAALRVACVEGEVFTAEAVARIRGMGEWDMLALLSSELDRRHRLIRAQRIQRVDGRLLSRYRFRHILFQRYLYRIQDEVERVHLHEQVGTALEALYGGQEQAAPIAVTLALHFQKAGVAKKAVHYLHQAGERAVQMSAYQEAVGHLTRGLALLEVLPDSPERALQELDLQAALGVAWLGPAGYSQEAQEAFARAGELCRQLGKTSELCMVMGHIATRHYVGAEYEMAREIAEEALDMARRAQEPLLVALGHWRLGFILFALGEYAGAHDHLEQVIAFYDPQQPQQVLLGLHAPGDPGASAMAYNACCLWCLGYPDGTLSCRQKSLASARERGHPFTLADVLSYGGCMVDSMRRDAQQLKEHAEALMEVAKEQGLWGWVMTGLRHRGEALAMMGQLEQGIAQMREGVAEDEVRTVRVYLSGTLGHLAQALGKAGRPQEGLTTLAEALAIVEKTGERYWEAELHRLRGELLLGQSDARGAEASLHKAIEVARRQQAKSWELRATVSLCRLWRRQGRTDEARRTLAELYGWFTEGFDTPDLRDARELLEELSRAQT
jgi:DNA-binding SARP family transcriptional activator/predicted ATPase